MTIGWDGTIGFRECISGRIKDETESPVQRECLRRGVQQFGVEVYGKSGYKVRLGFLNKDEFALASWASLVG